MNEAGRPCKNYALDAAGLVAVSAEGTVCATGIRTIQAAIERAWDAGLNSEGHKDIMALAPDEPFVGREDSSAQMGPCQTKMCFRQALMCFRQARMCFHQTNEIRFHFR